MFGVLGVFVDPPADEVLGVVLIGVGERIVIGGVGDPWRLPWTRVCLEAWWGFHDGGGGGKVGIMPAKPMPWARGRGTGGGPWGEDQVCGVATDDWDNPIECWEAPLCPGWMCTDPWERGISWVASTPKCPGFHWEVVGWAAGWPWSWAVAP